jgi:hypothetical protein
MHATRMLLLSLLLAIGSPMLAGAQPGNGRGGGFGPGARSGRTYDPKTVETVTGVIASIERVDAGRGPFRGIHLVLQTDKGETLPAHLGPAWYLDKQAMKFSPGDKLAVRGSRVTFGGKPAIIAAEVTKDGQTLRLREANGVPVWAGWRGRGR